ncbi:MAG: CopD family protein [Thermaurantimonas sp.]|uniref:CopD family protein n=1 Tax=Thermaurantimonas sp. TaxID=2681568 RepID=UPI003918CD84
MQYIKAIHIIFVVTWFAGLFYLPRLFVYIREADEKKQSNDLRAQLILMAHRLLYIITWPSAVLTFIFGNWMLIKTGYYKILLSSSGSWMGIKYLLVIALYAYQISLDVILRRLKSNALTMNSFKLRLYNEVPTVLLIAIVMLVVVKSNISAIYGVFGLLILVAVLLSASYLYRQARNQ